MKILILGGIGSGKSSFALSLSKKYKKKLFIATAIPRDKEIKEKIEKHKKERKGLSFTVIEEPYEPQKHINKEFDVIILDCITMWLTNLIEKEKEKEKEKIIQDFKNNFIKSKKNLIVVSNEVSMGIIPSNKLARKFLKEIADVNSFIVKNSDEVFFMVSGIPIKIK